MTHIQRLAIALGLGSWEAKRGKDGEQAASAVSFFPTRRCMELHFKTYEQVLVLVRTPSHSKKCTLVGTYHPLVSFTE